jgi:hypothetical protein
LINIFFFANWTDLCIAVEKLTTDQMHELNRSALNFGLGKQDFMSLLSRDLDEQESMRVAREEEQERAMYSVSTRSTGLHLILIYRKRGDAFTTQSFKKMNWSQLKGDW